jgi:hypothetical protein
MRLVRALSAGLALCLAGSAHAVLIGPDTTIPNDEVDSAGGRINLDVSSSVLLQPGTYAASLFNFDAGTAGDVTPFLATGSGNNYTAIAVGLPRVIAAAAQDQSLPFGGSAVFTLLAPTTVFAGIANSNQNPIALDNGVGLTEHEGGGQPATSYIVTLGGPVAPDGSFSNPDLGRQYAFSIDVQAVPEPATALSAALVGALCALRPRRRG